MKFSFRVALLVLMVGLVFLTVVTVGIASFMNAQSAAEDLSRQILEQTSLRVDQQVEKLLAEATGQSALNLELLKSGQLASHDFPRLVAYWTGVMRTNPNITSLFIGLEDTGESVGVSRLRGGRLSVWQTRHNSGPQQLDLSEYWASDYPQHPFNVEPGRSDLDIRPRPWFAEARNERRGIWTDTYVFLGVEGIQDVIGLTYAVPFYKDDGTLDAVVTADFDLDGLCRFLRSLRVGQDGFTFLVELRDDGNQRVIAHPQPELLLGPSRQAGKSGREFLPVDELADARVRAFLAQLPATGGGRGTAESNLVRFAADGVNYRGSYRRIQGEQSPRWMICTVLPEDDILAYVHQTNRSTILITVAALCLAVFASILISRQVAQPLEHLAREAAAVGSLRLEARPVVHSFVLEVDRLAAASEEMKAGLRSFQKYVPADLVRGLLDSGQEAILGGQRRTVTIYFSDIAGFTNTAESMPTEELVAHLGEYLGALSEQILAAGGTVDKYIGDAIMAFWGAPVENPRHAVAACIAACNNQQRLAQLRTEWQSAGKPLWRSRIGIHSGDVIVGNIGSEARMNYTVIGDSVNLASRLEGLCKYYGIETLISEATYLAAAGEIIARPIDWVSVKGRGEAVLIYELLGLANECDSATAEFAATFERALALYRRRDWHAALKLLDEILNDRPDDEPSRLLVTRCRQFLESPPAADWDGVQRMTGK